MQVVKISIPSNFPIARQIPLGHPMFQDVEFVINKDIEECDCWIVYDNLLKPETVLCPPNKTVLFTGEPSTVRVYNKQFVSQFGGVVTNQTNLSHPNKLYSQPFLPWLVGVEYDKQLNGFNPNKYLSANDLLNMDFSAKTKLISVITSNKTLSKGHRKRLDFVMYLQSILGDKLEIFGSGFNEIADKMDALKDFKYTVVIENSQHPHYWTEKLADAFLCECYPIYFGCSNIHDYFEADSLSLINIYDKISSGKLIEDVLDKNFYANKISSIKEGKRRILTDYNFFWKLKSLLIEGVMDQKQLVTIKPERLTLFDKLQSRLNRFV